LNTSNPGPESKRGLAWQFYLSVIVSGFTGLSAIGGGLSILSGIDKFPFTWLQNTPFSDFTIPATVLIAVGVCSFAAVVIIFLDKALGILVSAIGGIEMISWILVEIALINAPKPSPVEVSYLLIGLVQFGMAAYLLKSSLQMQIQESVPKEAIQ